MYVAQRGSLENPMIVTTNYLVYCCSVVISAERKKGQQKYSPPENETKENNLQLPPNTKTPLGLLAQSSKALKMSATIIYLRSRARAKFFTT